MKYPIVAILALALPAFAQTPQPLPSQNPVEIIAQGVTALVVGPPMVAVALGWTPETMATTFSSKPSDPNLGVEGRYKFFCEAILLGKWTPSGPGADSCPGGNWLNIYRFAAKAK